MVTAVVRRRQPVEFNTDAGTIVVESPVPRAPESRLAYSTGGETPTPPRVTAAAAPNAKGGIRIRLERLSGGRVITVVSGLPGPAAEIAGLARALRAACGTGGGAKQGVLTLQGDHRGAVELALAARGLKSKRAGG